MFGTGKYKNFQEAQNAINASGCEILAVAVRRAQSANVEGLYQKGWDGTDLNDATLTSDNKLIITGDDYGIVRLHNYPAIDPSACAEYTGHAEFVVGVELLRDDSQLITCGGNDMAIFQWLVKKVK